VNEILLYLNILLPVVLGWLIVLERRVSRIEGYLKGKCMKEGKEG
jgi:hypothetical protein